MNFSEYVPYVKPEPKKPSLCFSIWFRFKKMRDTINHREFMKDFEKTRQETANTVRSINIIGMDLEEARKKVPNIEIRNYDIDKTEAYCCSRCNVYVDKHNIITAITHFG